GGDPHGLTVASPSAPEGSDAGDQPLGVGGGLGVRPEVALEPVPVDRQAALRRRRLRVAFAAASASAAPLALVVGARLLVIEPLYRYHVRDDARRKQGGADRQEPHARDRQ